ncbi:MAG: hypothetical protein J6O60_09055 [Lachnospiraceae bacterium]|nr:hypothetical protein [Lachnospiraceae bacterium]
MARPKKDSQVVNLNIERSIYDKFVEFCDNTGLTKTVVVERALEMYIDAVNENPEILMQKKK